MRAFSASDACAHGAHPHPKALLCVVLAACALCAALIASLTPFFAPAEERAACAAPMSAASAIPYSGDTIAFYTADLSKRFGMLSNPRDEVQATLEGGFVSLSWTPSNNAVYKGFYLDAYIDDVGSWSSANFVAPVGDHYELTLPESYCGHAWPVAPEKYEDRGGGTTADQYYLTIPPADKIKPPVRTFTVTFTDGQGTVLKAEEVVQGEDATPPADPSRAGYSFAGWDRPYAGVAQDTEVNALWASLSGNSHRVTFVNGYGSTIVIRMVEDGQAATPPEDPVRDGYAFIGWDPRDFSAVKADMTITAQWISADLFEAHKAAQVIEALPADPKQLMGDAGNEQVAAAAAAYNALTAAQKEQVPEDDRMRLARCAIAVLPSDPFKVTTFHTSAITAAQAVYDSLPAEQREELDEQEAVGSRTYGRYLQNADWALKSLRAVNNVTLLSPGTYTGQVESMSSMGKSNSARSIAFTVKSVTVAGGKATAILEHGSNSSQTLYMGGVEYQNLQTNPTGRSYYEIPICLNSTFYFSVKGKNATDDTDAISYEMTVVADEAAMAPDAPESGGSGGAGSGGAGAKGSTGTGVAGPATSGVNLNTMVSGSTAKKQTAASGGEAAGGQANGGAAGGHKGSTLAEVSMGPAGEEALGADAAELMPAVAGVAMLFASLGVLGFTVWFLRREDALALGGLQ